MKTFVTLIIGALLGVLFLGVIVEYNKSPEVKRKESIDRRVDYLKYSEVTDVIVMTNDATFIVTGVDTNKMVLSLRGMTQNFDISIQATAQVMDREYTTKHDGSRNAEQCFFQQFVSTNGLAHEAEIVAIAKGSMTNSVMTQK